MFFGDSKQCPSKWLTRMLPLSTNLIVTPLTQLMKTHDNVLLAWTGPPLSIRLLHTILTGGHFPPKSTTTFALPSI